MRTIKDFFGIQELVCKHVYDKHKEGAWTFFDPRLIAVLLFIRQAIGKAITINTWHVGGSYSQRGLRCNLCSLVADKTKVGKLYVSAHQQGMAVDFDVKGMSAEAVRMWLHNNAYRLPYNIRVEKDVTWVHIDVRNDTNEKIIYFKG